MLGFSGHRSRSVLLIQPQAIVTWGKTSASILGTVSSTRRVLGSWGQWNYELRDSEVNFKGDQNCCAYEKKKRTLSTHNRRQWLIEKVCHLNYKGSVQLAKSCSDNIGVYSFQTVTFISLDQSINLPRQVFPLEKWAWPFWYSKDPLKKKKALALT